MWERCDGRVGIELQRFLPSPRWLAPPTRLLISSRRTPPLTQQLTEPNQATADNHHLPSLPHRIQAMKDWYIALSVVASLIYVMIAFFFAYSFFGDNPPGDPPGRFRKFARQELGCCILAIIGSLAWPVPAVLYIAVAGPMWLVNKYLCTSGHTCGMSLSRQHGLSSGALQAGQSQLVEDSSLTHL